MSVLLATAACGSAAVDPPPYHQPFERKLGLAGRVQAGLPYRFAIAVAYVAQARVSNCQSHNRLKGVTSQQGKTEYFPLTIQQGRFQQEIPLKSYDPGTECNWRLAGISLCRYSADDARGCSPLVRLTGTGINSPLAISVGCEEKRVLLCVLKPFGPAPVASPDSDMAIDLNIESGL